MKKNFKFLSMIKKREDRIKAEKIKNEEKIKDIKQRKEQINYLKYIKKNIPDERKSHRHYKWIIFISFIYIGFMIILFFTSLFEEKNIKSLISILISSIYCPLIVYMITSSTDNYMRKMEIRYERNCQFIEVAQPLYLNGYLEDEEELKKYYEALLIDYQKSISRIKDS